MVLIKGVPFNPPVLLVHVTWLISIYGTSGQYSWEFNQWLAFYRYQSGTQQVKKSAIAEQNRKRDIESSRNVAAALLSDRRRGAGTPPAAKVVIRALPLCRRVIRTDIGRVFLWIARTFWLGGLGHQALYRVSETLIRFGEHHILLHTSDITWR